MSSESISSRHLWAWLAVAMSAPLAHFSGGSWLGLLALGLLCTGVTALLPDGMEQVRRSKILCTVELVWLILLLTRFAPLSAAYWPGEKSEFVVPAVLLALAAYSCNKRPGRVAGVLLWILFIMYIPVFAAGVKDVEFRWLIPESMELSAWMAPVLLLPAIGGLLGPRGKSRKWNLWILAFGVGLWLITAGVLSANTAQSVSTPFRELSRSLKLGAASRFESVISVAVTLGWFGLYSYLVQCGMTCMEGMEIHGKSIPWIIAGAAYLLQYFNLRLDGTMIVVNTVLLWIIIPSLLGQKRSIKNENNA